ncbi:MAG: preprotein translocase subunit YajC [Clostridia bacterium]|jgi:preprotein translocase subunit YajC|nr:preprotein translocase subunit YajC [Clostridia bacterium]
MNHFTLLLLLDGETSAAAAQSPGIGSMLTLLIPILLLVVVFYFFIYRPQKKQEKQTAEMRNSIERGDVIATAGGIVGMVVKVKDDMLLIETGGDRTKIQIQKWAVHTVIEKANEPESTEVKPEDKADKDKKAKK